MDYFLRISLPCCLVLSATIALAAEEIEHPLKRGNHSSEGVHSALPIHLALGGQQEETNDSIFMEGLWSFLEREQALWFLQGGWQRQQQRNLLSLGLGWRYFPDSHWGLGYNLFYDQDTTQHQRRVGLGAEAWIQSLTLAVNSYFPANGWRPAGDLKHYRRRAARGYDLTLQGHLPALPQLGASVRYARYFGDEVTWGCAEKRYSHPKQWRWGIDFTPLPLLTLGYHRYAGLTGQAKHRVSAVLNYRFNLSLSQQLDPHQVSVLHSAQGQRLARVRREQTIVMQYAKKAVQPTPKLSVLPSGATGATSVATLQERLTKAKAAYENAEQFHASCQATAETTQAEYEKARTEYEKARTEYDDAERTAAEATNAAKEAATEQADGTFVEDIWLEAIKKKAQRACQVAMTAKVEADRQLDAAQAAHTDAEANYVRSRAAYDNAKQEFDKAESEYKAAEAASRSS